MEYPKFSVAMCVYGGDNPEWFRSAVESVLHQTVPPDEVVLVVDGPVPEMLNQVICECENSHIFNVVRLAKNQGLGNALRESLKHCTYNIVARMDSDDLAEPNRFELQLNYMCEHPQMDIVGGNIAEFIEKESNIVSYRKVPSTNAEILNYLKQRCPFNHMTVMFNKNSVEEVGGYRDWYWNEDYYLWIRMHIAGKKFANIPAVLVKVRVGKDMYRRRGGLRYFKSEAKLQKYMLDHKVIGFTTFTINIAKRFVVQVLLPDRLRGWVFQKFARSQGNE